MSVTRKTIIKSLLIGAMFAATLATGPGKAHAALGLDFSATAPYENGGPSALSGGTVSSGYSTVGWSFTANRDLYLNRLGVYDADKDRLHSEQHLVGIWSGGSLLASMAIDESSGNVPSSSASGMAQFHYGTLNNSLLLHAGQTYFVGATLYSGIVSNPGSVIPNTTDFDMFASINSETPVTINQNITYLNSAYAISTINQLTIPGSTYSGATYTVGANIDVTPTPIPAAAWLLGSGLLGLVGIRRRNP
jgi:hypothetical protein